MRDSEERGSKFASPNIRPFQAGSLAFPIRSTPDLPPPYASVATVQGTLPSVRASGTIVVPPGEDKFEDPPPYSIVIASINMRERDAEVSGERHVSPVASPKKHDASVTSGLASASHACPHPRC